MRNYTLITGASGLLGAYLLRNLLDQDVPCAVLVRSSRMETAAQRIESILTRMEREEGRTFPRPVILEGTLSENFGLDAERLGWVRRHCGRLLHNAASLVFERDPKTDEPYRSNVVGTEHAVEFALRCGIPQFHHVSTAYVCGLRTGVCRESELDVGQEWGNDYEKAKVTAEKTVRAAAFPEAPTFYRPAIITGDSVTGYTSTYHGFYTPLKVAASLVADRAFRGSSDDILHFLGMNGGEHKNFVPVEWIAQTIAALMAKPESVGKTFHLTPKNRVTVGQMYTVFTDALKRYGERHADTEASRAEKKGEKPLPPDVLISLMESFREQMKVYRSYWRDDPIFDASATDAALPDLPCPRMTDEVLMRLSMFALESNFGWPKTPPILPPFFVRDRLGVQPSWGTMASLSSETSTALSTRGPGGGDWTLSLKNGQIASVEEGIAPDAGARALLNTEMLNALQAKKITPRQALCSGAVVWKPGKGGAPSPAADGADQAEAARFLTTLASSGKEV